jgi:FKBP-type peptidyl-prolyl cis-trans isomerase FkpA
MRKLLFALPLLFLFGCDKSDNQAEEDRQKILTYIEDNGYDAEETGSGLFYQILEPGNGLRPNLNDQVHVYYKGWLTNGSVFDESAEEGVIFRLNGLIQAWKEGIPLIEERGRILLFCPSELAYGSSSRPGIPANSVLIFEIELKTVIR